MHVTFGTAAHFYLSFGIPFRFSSLLHSICTVEPQHRAAAPLLRRPACQPACQPSAAAGHPNINLTSYLPLNINPTSYLNIHHKRDILPQHPSLTQHPTSTSTTNPASFHSPPLTRHPAQYISQHS